MQHVEVAIDADSHVDPVLSVDPLDSLGAHSIHRLGHRRRSSRRSWSTDVAEVDDAEVSTTGDRSLDELGLDDALAEFRPILSYNELGELLHQRPVDLHDAIGHGLGTDEPSSLPHSRGPHLTRRLFVALFATKRRLSFTAIRG